MRIENEEFLTNPVAGVACRERLVAGLHSLGSRQKREQGQGQEHNLFHSVFILCLVNGEF